ncbi:MAG: hypothetical protein ACYDEF_02275 [Methanosarcina sp.]
MTNIFFKPQARPLSTPCRFQISYKRSHGERVNVTGNSDRHPAEGFLVALREPLGYE